MKTYCIAQGTQLNTLQWSIWKKKLLKKYMYMHTHFGHLMQRANSLEKTLMLGKIEGKRRREQQRTR